MAEKVNVIKTNGFVMEVDRVDENEDLITKFEGNATIEIPQSILAEFNRIAGEKDIETEALIVDILKSYLSKYAKPEEKYPEKKSLEGLEDIASAFKRGREAHRI